jgi:hypothetical protein
MNVSSCHIVRIVPLLYSAKRGLRRTGCFGARSLSGQRLKESSRSIAVRNLLNNDVRNLLKMMNIAGLSEDGGAKSHHLHSNLERLLRIS